MWTYTTYIFGKYCEKCEPQECTDLSFKQFSDFVFDVLWRQKKLVFHDGEEDLFDDFVYLQKLGVVKLEGDEKNIEKARITITDKPKLLKIVKVVEDSANLTKIKLFDVYTSRINEAVKENACVVPSK